MQPVASITAEEIKAFEQILAGLLKGASQYEQDNILRLHIRLQRIFEAQQSDRTSLEYLQNLSH
jgi:hypothetical protein